MSSKTVSVVIEGSLLQDDEESSGSESDDDGNVAYDKPLEYNNSDNSDDEELEIFNGSTQKVIPFETRDDTNIPKSPEIEISIVDAEDDENLPTVSKELAQSPVLTEEKKSLVSLMGIIAGSDNYHMQSSDVASADETSKIGREDSAPVQVQTESKVPIQIVGFQDPVPSASQSQPLETVYSSAVSSDDNTGATDVFGISYRPYGKTKSTYDMPSGPAFEDEAEFEKELMESSVVTGTGTDMTPAAAALTEEDEFDFEDESAVAEFQSTVQIVATAAYTRENAEKDAATATSPVALSSGGSDCVFEGGNDSEARSADENVEPGDKDNAEVVHDAARAALAEITGIYSSGLGDHEVTLLSSADGSEEKSGNKGNLPSLSLSISGVGGTIEEEDEEEFERQEKAEEVKKHQEMDQEQRRLRELKSQWDAVERIAAESSTSNVGDKPKSPTGRGIVSIKYEAAEKIFRDQDLSEFRPHVILNDPDQSWSLLSSNVKLSKASIPTSEVELPFLIAQIDYNPDEFSDHLAILKTIYKALVVDNGAGSSMCPKQGAHWEAIGFQGSDPRTDLNRSMKMLSVLQILHMIETEPNLSQQLYANSLGSGGAIPSPSGASGGVAAIDDSWPFMCVGIAMTKHAIDALRMGVLTKDVNKAKSCMAVLHEFHHACFFCFSRRLAENPHIHHAVHLADIRKEVSKDPRGLLRAFRNFKAPKPASSEGGGKESSYDDIDEDQREEGHRDSSNKKDSSWLSFGRSKESKAKKFLAADSSK